MDAGWTRRLRGGRPGAGRRPRAAAVPPCVTLRGRWSLLRPQRRLGSPPSGWWPWPGASSRYFNAVAHMQVGVALLIEYTSPVAVIAWLWLRRGRAAAAVLTVVGARGGRRRAGAGARPALRRRREPGRRGLGAGRDGRRCRTTGWSPPTRTAPCPASCWPTGGLLLGGVALLLAGLVGLLPWSVSTATVHFDGLRGGLVGAGAGARPGHRLALLRDRDRRDPPARLAGGVVRRACPRCSSALLLGLAAARGAARGRCRSWVAC